MTEASWEKSNAAIKVHTPARARFAVVGVLLLGAMAFLLLTGTISGSRYFITVNDLLNRPELAGQTVKVSGAVIGNTIRFDANTKTIYFTVAHVTDDAAALEKAGGLAQVLENAVNDPTAKHLQVAVPNQAMPDLLKDQAQAILTGKLLSNGVFQADELLLKCPSKYSSDVPQQVSQ